MNDAGVELRVLGPLEVRAAGQTIAVGGPRQHAVLAALLLARGRVVTVDRLLDAVWFDAPPSSALSTLQGYVSLLRRALRSSGTTVPGILRWQAPGYLLDVPPEAVDADLFASLVDEGTHLRLKDPGAAREVLRRGLSLWRGDPYADLPDHPFLREERMRLEELRAHALEERIAADLDVGDHRRVLAELPGLVEHDPLRERLSALQALALYRCGRQAEALEVFERLRHTLANELGIDPGTEVRRLHEQVLRQDSALDWRPSATTASASMKTAATPRPSIGRRPDECRRPLIGRRDEFHRLDRAWAETMAGSGSVLLVAGDPGIGKTRLVEEFVHSVAARGGATAWGRCVERGAAPAFWPWRQVLRHAVLGLDDHDLAAAFGVGSAELAQLVPESRERVAIPEAAAVEDDSWFRFYDAVIGFLMRTAAHGPLLVALDDLHWGDPASLELLELLANEVSSVSLMVVGTFRDADADRGATLSDSLAVLARRPAVERITLTGLDEEAVADLVATTNGTTLDAHMAALVHQRTGGNPFFVAELAGILGYGESPEIMARALPPGVRAVLDQRLAALPGLSCRALSVAAVLGREFDVPVVADVMHVPMMEVFEALDAALDARLVEESSGSYRFRHALVGDAVYARLSVSERLRLHARAGKALEVADAPASVLAHHYTVAAPLGYGFAAVDAVERAANQALEVAAGEQAAEHLREGLRLLMEYGPADPRRELRLHARLATLLVEIHGWTSPEVRTSADRVRELARKVPDAPELAPTLWALQGYLTVGADFEGAFEISDELLRLGERNGDAYATAAGLQTRGTTSWHTGRLHDAHTLLSDAARRIETMRHPLDDATAEIVFALSKGHMSNVCHLMHHREHLVVLEQEYRRLIDDETAPPFARGFTILVLCTSALLDGRADAGPLAEEAVRVNRKYGFPQLLAIAEVVAGRMLAESDPSAGVARIERALADSAVTGMRMLVSYHLRHLAAAQRLAGRPEDARSSLLEALAAADSTGEMFAVPDVLIQLAELAIDDGDHTEAHDHLTRAIDHALRQGAAGPQGRAESMLAGLAESVEVQHGM